MKIWAHRGCSQCYPENTLTAFEKAMNIQGLEGIELDIQLTKDGQIVVIHDEKVDRTTDSTGYIRDYSLSEIKKLLIRTEDGLKEHIPTMEEVFDLLEPTGLTINIEMKTGIVMYPQLEEKIVELTNRKGWNDRVIYSSFNHYSVKKIKELNPEAKTGLLYADGPIDMPGYCKTVGADALHPALYNLQFPGFVQECHDKGIDINVWTVNEEAYMKMAEQWGVHAIITNYPDKARKLLG